MARLVPAFEQFFDSAGNPLVKGKLYFYESGSSTLEKETFSNADNTVSNANPVILNGDGRAPNIFGGGSYRVVLTDRDDVQILSRDPVGGETGTTFGADWNAESTYGIYDVIREDGKYWISKSADNIGNRPSTDSGDNWVLWPESQPINPNVIINGDKRINQEDFGGNWSALSDGDYGFDMWKKSGSNMVQIIEAGNFVNSADYTLSGDGVVETQITSPASGNWTISVSQSATNIKLEYGEYSTAFVPDLYSVNLGKCLRFFYVSPEIRVVLGTVLGKTLTYVDISYPVPMRASPATTLIDIIDTDGIGFAGLTASNNSPDRLRGLSTDSAVNTAGRVRFNMIVDARL